MIFREIHENFETVLNFKESFTEIQEHFDEVSQIIWQNVFKIWLNSKKLTTVLIKKWRKFF